MGFSLSQTLHTKSYDWWPYLRTIGVWDGPERVVSKVHCHQRTNRTNDPRWTNLLPSCSLAWLDKKPENELQYLTPITNESCFVLNIDPENALNCEIQINSSCDTAGVDYFVLNTFHKGECVFIKFRFLLTIYSNPYLWLSRSYSNL